MKKILAGILCIGLLSGCAKKAQDIKPSYVSTLEYSDNSCKELKREVIEINRELRVISGVQDDTATKDALSVAASLVFWPALFLTATGDDNKRKIADLKGRYDTVKIVAKKKKCKFSKELK
ncbi:MAG: hypothetical protein COA92_08720 [Sulfurovum sp.]|nr:MAG: hypothetical protein COA92_08720 [Sulfurovum sp.]